MEGMLQDDMRLKACRNQDLECECPNDVQQPLFSLGQRRSS